VIDKTRANKPGAAGNQNGFHFSDEDS
jgi:hypothetical protein